jgi:hypothetical protein
MGENEQKLLINTPKTPKNTQKTPKTTKKHLKNTKKNAKKRPKNGTKLSPNAIFVRFSLSAFPDFRVFKAGISEIRASKEGFLRIFKGF